MRGGREERQRGERPGRGLRQAGRNGKRPHAEFARDIARRDDPVRRDVVGARRPCGDDAPQQCLPRVLLVHELHRQFRSRHREGQPAGQEDRSAGHRAEQAARRALPADGVRPEHDGRPQQVQVGSAGRRPRQQQVFDLGLLPGIEQPGRGPGGPVLGHPDGVVPVEAVSGHRGREDETPCARRRGGVEGVERAVDVDRLDRLRRGGAGHLERQVHHDVSMTERLTQQLRVADVAALVLRLRPAVRRGVERAARHGRHVRYPVVGLEQGHQAEPKGAGRAGHRDRQASHRLRCHLSIPSRVSACHFARYGGRCRAIRA